MGMSTHVHGYITPDEKFQTMKRIYEDCECAGIDIPDKVSEFFNYGEPDDNGVECDIKQTEWTDGDMCSGIEIRVADIPPDVYIIRFYNSW